MSHKTEPDLLDSLLEQPALIADRGFSERVQRRLSRPPLTRRGVFLVLGSAWLLLAFLGGPPGFFTDNAAALLEALERIGGVIAGDVGQAATGLPGILVVLPVLGLLLFQLVSQTER
jgi:hypothetical protein